MYVRTCSDECTSQEHLVHVGRPIDIRSGYVHFASDPITDVGTINKPLIGANYHSPSYQPVWRNGRAYDSGPRGPGFETRLGQLVFFLDCMNTYRDSVDIFADCVTGL